MGRVSGCPWPLVGRGREGGGGYVAPLSGLLTGLPPFMTTGSPVVLLEGGPPASLGTASPTSCNEGSRYIATGGMAGWEKERRTGGGKKDRKEGRGRREEGDTGVVGREVKGSKESTNEGQKQRV